MASGRWAKIISGRWDGGVFIHEEGAVERIGWDGGEGLKGGSVMVQRV